MTIGNVRLLFVFTDTVLDRRNILLNATYKMVCVILNLNADSSGMKSYFVQLTWTDDQAGYDVYFPSAGQNITISDCKM